MAQHGFQEGPQEGSKIGQHLDKYRYAFPKKPVMALKLAPRGPAWHPHWCMGVNMALSRAQEDQHGPKLAAKSSSAAPKSAPKRSNRAPQASPKTASKSVSRAMHGSLAFVFACLWCNLAPGRAKRGPTWSCEARCFVTICAMPPQLRWNSGHQSPWMLQRYMQAGS